MKYSLIYIIPLLLFACNESYSPKPTGFLRIDYPQKQYIASNMNLPYSFEYPVYGKLLKDTSRIAEKYWTNIVFLQFNGKIHISFKNIDNNLPELIEDSRRLAYKHTIKADEINEVFLSYPDKKVHGILYDIKGNAASSVQFFLTDSTKNFLRGSLYFAAKPNKDSLAPVIDFFRKDIDHLIETFSWKSN